MARLREIDAQAHACPADYCAGEVIPKPVGLYRDLPA